MSAIMLSIDDRPLGEYVIDIRLWNKNDLAGTPSEHSMSIEDVEILRGHIDNVLTSLYRRRLEDSICGPCDVCNNTRMEKVERHSRDWLDHCSVCKPKLDAAYKDLAAGQPPAINKKGKKK